MRSNNNKYKCLPSLLPNKKKQQQQRSSDT